jgi:hypothetical protein
VRGRGQQRAVGREEQPVDPARPDATPPALGPGRQLAHDQPAVHVPDSDDAAVRAQRDGVHDRLDTGHVEDFLSGDGRWAVRAAGG